MAGEKHYNLILKQEHNRLDKSQKIGQTLKRNVIKNVLLRLFS